jgi:hypothetical protein
MRLLFLAESGQANRDVIQGLVAQLAALNKGSSTSTINNTIGSNGRCQAFSPSNLCKGPARKHLIVCLQRFNCQPIPLQGV